MDIYFVEDVVLQTRPRRSQGGSRPNRATKPPRLGFVLKSSHYASSSSSEDDDDEENEDGSSSAEKVSQGSVKVAWHPGGKEEIIKESEVV